MRPWFLLSIGYLLTEDRTQSALTYEGAADRALPLTVEHTQTAQAGALGHTGIPAADHTCQVGAMAVTLARLLNRHRDQVRGLSSPHDISADVWTD